MTTRLDYLRFLARYMKAMVVHTPVWAHVFVTYRCNLSCPYCYLRSPFRCSSDMPIGVFDRVSKSLRRVGCGLVAFMGGEPTLNSDLPLMIAKARDSGMLTHISTNGSRLTAEYINELGQAGINVFNLSIDAMDENSSSPKALRHLSDTIERLVERRRVFGYSIYVNQVVAPWNLDEIFPMVEYLSERAIKLTVAFVVDGDPTDDTPKGFGGFKDEADRRRLVSTVEKLIALKERGCAFANSQAYLRAVLEFAHTGKTTWKCRAGRENLQVDVDGRILLCSRYPNSPFDSYCERLTSSYWRSLQSQVKSIVHKCNPTCLSTCQFETTFICRHPWGTVLDHIRHLPQSV